MQHFRVARPTNRLTEITQFYTSVLGFVVLRSFENHDGFDGVMLGRSGAGVHLEFTYEHGAAPPAVPSASNHDRFIIGMSFAGTLVAMTASSGAISTSICGSFIRLAFIRTLPQVVAYKIDELISCW